MSIESHSGVSRNQFILLVFITLFWGVNWPIMKMAVTHYPPMTFRGLSILFGLGTIAIYFKTAGISFHVPRKEWGTVLRLGLLNMAVWHVLLMVALPHLNSGRASVIGYTMPVFSALWGASLYKQKFAKAHFIYIALALLGILLLLSTEFTSLSGAPLAAILLLGATATWALGTQQLRRTKTDLHILTIAFWMTVITAFAILPFSVGLERQNWAMPSVPVLLAILYNGVLIFGFCHTAWAYIARTLSPVASSVSISLIPVLGLLSGAFFLKEQLYWQDGLAIILIGTAVLGTIKPEKIPPLVPNS
ncbi:MAG: DMT family transporter [Hyphomonadaceae bacterium]|nr:DMT family transporter [Hyphomonadaceae bacterium]